MKSVSARPDPKFSLQNTLCLVMLCLLFMILASCAEDNKPKKIFEEYTVKPAVDFVVYGVNVKSILKRPLGDVSKELNSRIRTDDEVAVIFIRKNGDFAGKTKKTGISDNIDIIYGPVEDVNLYKNPQRVVPQRMKFYGAFHAHEKSNIKNTVLDELRKVLPHDSETKPILERIRTLFITGPYNEKISIEIFFSMPEFPVASFYIGYGHDQLIYTYEFSKTKEIYP